MAMFVVILCPRPIVGRSLVHFFCCWRRSGTTSGAMHTAMPRTIVPLSMYIITASSYRYKDGCTHFSLPSGILRQLDV